MKAWLTMVITQKGKEEKHRMLPRKSGKWVERVEGAQETFGKHYSVYFLLNRVHWQQDWAVPRARSVLTCFLRKGQPSSTQQSGDTREANDHQPGGVPGRQGTLMEKTHVFRVCVWLRKCAEQCITQPARGNISSSPALPHDGGTRVISMKL